MILTQILWLDQDEYLTAEITLDKKQAWDSIEQARKVKPNHEILAIEFTEFKGDHHDQ